MFVMVDIVLRPVVSTVNNSYCFKSECLDNTVLVDIKSEFAEFLRRKDYDVRVETGWYENK